MRYIIIGIVIVWVAIPTGMALLVACDISDFFWEWWDAFKFVFAFSVAVGGAIVAVMCLVLGALQICS